MPFTAPTLPPDVVHPIPMRGVSCACGAELEVEGSALVCPRGCAVELAPNTRPTGPRTRYRALPSTRICPRCSTLIEREPGQRGATPAIHPNCRTTAEIQALAEKRAYSARYYATHSSQWDDYADRKRTRLASPANPPAAQPSE